MTTSVLKLFKISNSTKHTLFIFALISISLLLTSCAPANFSNANSPAEAVATALPTPTPPSSCTTNNINSITQLTKIIMVVDTSGSNGYPTRSFGSDICYPGDADYAQCTPASDPTRSIRGGALQNFVSTYSHKTNFQYAFEIFAGTSATVLSPLSADISSFTQAVTGFLNFTNSVDNDETPYKVALSQAGAMIRGDSDLHAISNPNYYVILMTDGAPTDYSGTTATAILQEYDLAVSNLTSVAAGRVKLSTIHYGHVNDSLATGLLTSMAQQGGGKYEEVTDAIVIDNVIPGSQSGCP